MKIIRPHTGSRYGGLAMLGAAAILLAACASVPPAPAGSAAARARLTQLQSNPELGTLAPAAMKEADLAVRAAEVPQHDQQMAGHLVYLADRKVDIAAARAAIVSAEKADAGRYAAPELAAARAKLAAAEAAVTSEHMPEALRLADESAVEADLANAKAGEAKALAVNADMKQGNAVLGDELQRGSGGQP